MLGHLKRAQQGAAMAATIIALPVLGIIIGGAIQLGLLFEAKATLNHVMLQAARAGAIYGAEPGEIRLGLVKGLLPIFSPPKNLDEAELTLGDMAFSEVLSNSCVSIINPTSEAFIDFEFLLNNEFMENQNDKLRRFT